MAAYDSHTIGRERSSLVGADRGGVTHRLTGIQMSHQVVVGHHSLQRPHTHSHNATVLMPMTHEPETGCNKLVPYIRRQILACVS